MAKARISKKNMKKKNNSQTILKKLNKNNSKTINIPDTTNENENTIQKSEQIKKNVDIINNKKLDLGEFLFISIHLGIQGSYITFLYTRRKRSVYSRNTKTSPWYIAIGLSFRLSITTFWDYFTNGLDDFVSVLYAAVI